MSQPDCPPVELTGNSSLRSLVRDYLRRYGGRQDEELRYRKMPNLAGAIYNAAAARREDGKCASHQRRIGNSRLVAFASAMADLKREIAACGSFEELHKLIGVNRTKGIGALAVYDTALRIGAFLGLHPKAVYLHAGTREGARALGLDVGGDRIAMGDLPAALQGLRANQAEDFLCIYKERLRGERAPLARCGGRGRNGSC